MLRNSKFGVFNNVNASNQHLSVPVECLFNRWNLSPNTSIAQPVDTQQVLDEGRNTRLCRRPSAI